MLWLSKKIIIVIIILLLLCSSILFYYVFQFIGLKHKKYRNNIILQSYQYYSKDKYD